MHRLVLMIGVASTAMLAAGTASAQTGGSRGTAASSPDVTVRGPERMVCRNVTRTATRMRASRVCRPVSQMNAVDQRNQDEVLAEAADSLEMYGEKVSTNCTGGMGGSHNTPLGPQ